MVEFFLSLDEISGTPIRPGSTQSLRDTIQEADDGFHFHLTLIRPTRPNWNDVLYPVLNSHKRV